MPDARQQRARAPPLFSRRAFALGEVNRAFPSRAAQHDGKSQFKDLAGWRDCSAWSTNHSGFGAHALLNAFTSPENRFLRAHFREYEFRHGADSAELAHVH